MADSNGPRRRQTPKKKSPAYQWYPNDWAIDEVVSELTNEAYGLFRRLYDHAWVNNGLPADVDKIAAFSRCDSREKFDQLWMAIDVLFPPDGSGRRRNEQQEEHRRKQRKNSKIKQKAAKERWKRMQEARNAYASARALLASGSQQCLALSIALSSSDPDQKQEEQRAYRRAKPARMVLPEDRRQHLLAAVHHTLDRGEPFLTADGPNIAEISEELKVVARKLNVTWTHSRELDPIISAAIATHPPTQVLKRVTGGGRFR